MAEYWIAPEKSNLALAESNLNRAVARLWEEEYDLVLNNNTPVDALNLRLSEENIALSGDGLIVGALNEEERLTESNLAVLYELSGMFSPSTVLHCESDSDFNLVLIADENGRLEEDII